MHKYILMACLFSLCCLTMPAWGMFLTLVDGTILTGEILENDETKLIFRRWDNQGVVEIPWDHIHIQQRQQLQQKLGLLPVQEISHTIPGSIFYLKSGGSITGKVLERKNAMVTIKTKNSELQIPASNILKEEPVEVPMIEVFKPQELYQEICKRYDLSKADQHWQLAQFLMQISDWNNAKLHLEKAQAMNPTLQSKIEGMQQKMAQQMQDQNRQKLMQRFQIYRNSQRFPEALQTLDQLKELLPEQDWQRHQQETLALQREHFQITVAQQWANKAQQKIAVLAYERNTLLSDIQKQLLQELDTEIIADLTQELQISEVDLQNYWETRTQNNQYTYSYQHGTFIVGLKGKEGVKANIEVKTTRLDGWGKSKLLNAQEWWENATSSTRKEWMSAFYFENHWNVVKYELKPCPHCSGKGTQYSQGNIVLCIYCHGLKYERAVTVK